MNWYGRNILNTDDTLVSEVHQNMADIKDLKEADGVSTTTGLENIYEVVGADPLFPQTVSFYNKYLAAHKYESLLDYINSLGLSSVPTVSINNWAADPSDEKKLYNVVGNLKDADMDTRIIVLTWLNKKVDPAAPDGISMTSVCQKLAGYTADTDKLIKAAEDEPSYANLIKILDNIGLTSTDVDVENSVIIMDWYGRNTINDDDSIISTINKNSQDIVDLQSTGIEAHADNLDSVIGSFFAKNSLYPQTLSFYKEYMRAHKFDRLSDYMQDIATKQGYTLNDMYVRNINNYEEQNNDSNAYSNRLYDDIFGWISDENSYSLLIAWTWLNDHRNSSHKKYNDNIMTLLGRIGLKNSTITIDYDKVNNIIAGDPGYIKLIKLTIYMNSIADPYDTHYNEYAFDEIINWYGFEPIEFPENIDNNIINELGSTTDEINKRIDDLSTTTNEISTIQSYVPSNDPLPVMTNNSFILHLYKMKFKYNDSLYDYVMDIIRKNGKEDKINTIDVTLGNAAGEINIKRSLDIIKENNYLPSYEELGLFLVELLNTTKLGITDIDSSDILAIAAWGSNFANKSGESLTSLPTTIENYKNYYINSNSNFSYDDLLFLINRLLKPFFTTANIENTSDWFSKFQKVANLLVRQTLRPLVKKELTIAEHDKLIYDIATTENEISNLSTKLDTHSLITTNNSIYIGTVAGSIDTSEYYMNLYKEAKAKYTNIYDYAHSIYNFNIEKDLDAELIDVAANPQDQVKLASLIVHLYEAIFTDYSGLLNRHEVAVIMNWQPEPVAPTRIEGTTLYDYIKSKASIYNIPTGWDVTIKNMEDKPSYAVMTSIMSAITKKYGITDDLVNVMNWYGRNNYTDSVYYKLTHPTDDAS